MSSVTESTGSSFAARGARAAELARTAVYCASFVAFGLTAASLGPALPGLIENAHARPNTLGLLLAAHSIGFLLGSLGGARLFDRLNGHTVMAVSLLSMSAGLAFAPVAPTFWLLAVVLILLGTAECTLDAGANTLLVWTHGARTAPYINGLHFFFGVGAFLAPLVVAQVARFKLGAGVSFRVLALLVLPAAIPFFRLHAPRPRAATGEKDEAVGGETKDEAGESKTGASRDSVLVVLLAAFLFLYLGAEAGFSGWIYSYTIALHLSDAEGAAYLTSLFWGTLTLGRLLAVPLAARFHPRTLLAASVLGCLLSALFVVAGGGSFAFVAAGTILLGLSMASIFPTTFALAGRAMRLDGRTTGWLLVGASGGAIFLPWLAGLMFEWAGARSLMFVVAVDLLAAALVFAPLARRAKRDAEVDARS